MGSKILWFTGMSGSGKTTLCNMLLEYLVKNGKTVKIIDGDELRNGPHKHFDFTPKGIIRNNDGVIELCKELSVEFDYILVSLITPFESIRKKIKNIFKDEVSIIYLQSSIETLIKRDVKGLYKKALCGEINNFIGISPSVPFEIPFNPDIVVNTEASSITESLDKILTIFVEHENE